MRRPYDGGSDLTRRGTSPARIASSDPDRAVPDWARRFSRNLAITDALSIGWAAVGVQMVRIPGIDSHSAIAPPDIASIALTVGTAVLWFGALQLTGSRDHRFIGLGATEYKRVARATLSVYGSLALCSYAFDLRVPRQYVLLMMPVGLVALLLSRFLWRRWLHLRRSSGEMMTRVLAVGDQRTVNDLVRDLRRAPMSGYVVVGACVPAGTDCSSVDIPIAGDLAHVVSTVQRIDADAVAVTASGAFGADDVRRLGWELEDTTAELMLAPALTNIAGPRIHTQPVAGLPLIHVARPTYHAANQLLKRSLDLLLAVLLLILLLPVFVVTAIAIKVGSAGPVFFRQVRAGLGGSTFRILKFRSMVPDAELRLTETEYRARDAGNEVMFKVRNDPRVTAVGRFIRRYSIDELPQLLNVIAGSMSLVGPRPPLMREIELYGADARRRLLVKPGMTGLWQVSGRSDLTWDDTVRLDMYYIENWSLTVDLVILWKTAKAVLAPEGAY